jgi:hypothetical protein
MLSTRTVLFFFIFLTCYLGPLLTGLCQVGDPPVEDDVPITGIEWLLLAGGALGIRKMSRLRKKEI